MILASFVVVDSFHNQTAGSESRITVLMILNSEKKNPILDEDRGISIGQLHEA